MLEVTDVLSIAEICIKSDKHVISLKSCTGIKQGKVLKIKLNNIYILTIITLTLTLTEIKIITCLNGIKGKSKTKP